MPGNPSMTDNSNTDCALSVTGPYESTAMVTGPIPRNPNATRPNANTGDAIMRASKPIRPSQYALKLPATSPARIFSEAPPSRDDDTTSRTCADSVDVKIFTSSGMIAPARVPHVITVDNFRHIVPSPSSGMSRYETRYVISTDTIDVSHTRIVRGVYKFITVAAAYFARIRALLTRYEIPLATTIMTRIMKIHTSSCTWTVSFETAVRMNVINATPVTPYVSNPSALGPTESPALSPVQSAITPGLRASSSFTLKTIFIRSAPISAILVKMPPAMRNADAPSDSPIAKPRKQEPAKSLGIKRRMHSMMNNSTLINSIPMLIPASSGIECSG